jgi:hypothetical protein
MSDQQKVQQEHAVPLASLDTADMFEPTIEESILASGAHQTSAWEPAEDELAPARRGRRID